MRVLMPVANVGGLGGVERRTADAARWLTDHGDRVDVLFTDRTGADRELEDAAASLAAVPALDVRLSEGVQAARRLAPAVRAGVRARPDVVYLNRFEHLPTALGVRAAARTPIVCHLRYFTPHGGLGWKSRTVSRFVAVSRATADQWVAAGLRASRIEVVPDGIDLERFRPPTGAERAAARAALGVGPDTLVVLYSGRVHGEKGVDVLLDAWERLALDPGAARLVVLGAQAPGEPVSGYEAALVARGVRGVQWLPARDDVLPVLHAADLAAAPSRHESFGCSIVEAMAAGVPVVASRAGGIPETLAGFDELLVPVDDAPALAHRIEEYAHWRTQEPGLGERCRAHVVSRFGREPSLGALRDVLAEVAR